MADTSVDWWRILGMEYVYDVNDDRSKDSIVAYDKMMTVWMKPNVAQLDLSIRVPGDMTRL